MCETSGILYEVTVQYSDYKPEFLQHKIWAGKCTAILLLMLMALGLRPIAQEHDGKLVANSIGQTRTSRSSVQQLFQERDTDSHSGQCEHTGLVQESDEKYSPWQAKPEHEIKMYRKHATK